MSKHKCQVCDGPIVNGRCTWCGMPYRNDEILYHLNESRSDHYRHATDKAREELRNGQIPLGDKNPGQENISERLKKPQQQNAAPGKGRAYGSSVRGRSEYAPGKNRYKTPTVGEYTSGKNRKQGTTGTYSEKKKFSGTGIVITIIIIICALLPTAIEFVKSNYSYELASLFDKNVDTDNLQAFYVLTKGDGDVLVEDWFPEGDYVVELEAGYGMLTLQRGGAEKQFDLTEEDNQVNVKLEHGDVISLGNVDAENRTAILFFAEN